MSPRCPTQELPQHSMRLDLMMTVAQHSATVIFMIGIKVDPEEVASTVCF